MIPYEEREKVYTNALITYGEEKQCIVAIEELSECAKELCKVLRGKGDPEHLAEEIADARICLEHMIYFFSLEERVECYMDSKVRRLDIKLKKGAGREC
jgi:hypothetical protein